MRIEQVEDLARYNQWMNERLYSVCAQLSDDERRANRGLFFHSIHGTLNHLLLADRIWMGRFTGNAFAAKGLDEELYTSFAELEQERRKTDAAIIAWAATLTDEMLAGTLQYTSVVNPAPRRYEMWLAVTHFFNHQTHHRGQLTAALGQLGKDYGVTDLIWMPAAVERNVG